MTLISNEIFLLNTLKESFIICAADTRLTYRKESDPKKKYKKGKKIFKIEYLNGTVSFWGATSLIEDRKQKFLWDWLPNYITKSSNETSLLGFANGLRTELNKKMHKTTAITWSVALMHLFLYYYCFSVTNPSVSNFTP